jgi:cytochrome c biogenesis factor
MFYGMNFLQGHPFLGLFFFPLMIWSLCWKGYALWTAAKKDSKPWFIALLVVNTMGILEILYIYIFSKEKVVKTSPDLPLVAFPVDR